MRRRFVCDRGAGDGFVGFLVLGVALALAFHVAGNVVFSALIDLKFMFIQRFGSTVADQFQKRIDFESFARHSSTCYPGIGRQR